MRKWKSGENIFPQFLIVYWLLFFSSSVVQLFATPWTAAHQASLPFTISWVYSDSHPLIWWCHPTILSSVIPFSCPRSFLTSDSFKMSWLLASGGQSIGASASTSVLPMNIQDWFPLGSTVWISLQSKRLSWVSSNTTVQKYQFFGAQPSLWYNSHIHIWLLEKLHLWLDRPLSVMSLLFSVLSRFVIAFLSRSKCLNFVASVTICSDFGAQENSLSLFPLFPHLLAVKWWDQKPWS